MGDTLSKGQCLSCEFCQVKDDGYERRLVCMQTKRGKTLTWTMHTGELAGAESLGNGLYTGGSFAPTPIEELDEFLKDAIKNRIPPKWCKFRNSEDVETKEQNNE